MRVPGLHKAYEVLTRCVSAFIVGSREVLVRKHIALPNMPSGEARDDVRHGVREGSSSSSWRPIFYFNPKSKLATG